MNELTTKGTYKKVDLTVNGDKTSQAVAAQKKREEKLFPLRLNSKTVIYVKKENQNTHYAEKAKKKIGIE
ncbi:hypothetical protein [Bacteroides graminisolvens]|uniref:Uncharacterized protein n=1 Tax=Bacteroides graminisolvens DSM 19988 = JCM 15093 TaxID=1121097 RepID=A0A069D4X6_9BACE|nr:hypothetical protein [Bacteroides graminisolvens]GAK37457.1 hypothetical protein JCM15093_2708 [Bacteroides graminisolvens DSM 19988 = JCM 15093]